jgi:S1-C subfamily serine protease
VTGLVVNPFSLREVASPCQATFRSSCRDEQVKPHLRKGFREGEAMTTRWKKHLSVVWWLWVVGFQTWAIAAPESAHDKSVVELVRQVRPSIVRVRVVGTLPPQLSASGSSIAQPIEVTGTGFAFDMFGNIATNAHLFHVNIDGKPVPCNKISIPTTTKIGNVQLAYDKLDYKILVDLPDGRTVEAQLRGEDGLSDLAVLTIDGIKLPYLHFANPDQIQVGEGVIAVGYALGLAGEPSYSRGIVSALDRSLPDGSMSGLIQTDAAINHGNSGGPLLNMRGQIIGVNTYTTTAQGIYFARSGKTAERFLGALSGGGINRTSLGMQTESVTYDQAKRFNLMQGVIVLDVSAGSAAQKAGIHPYDIITKLDAFVIRNQGELSNGLVFLFDKKLNAGPSVIDTRDLRHRKLLENLTYRKVDDHTAVLELPVTVELQRDTREKIERIAQVLQAGGLEHTSREPGLLTKKFDELFSDPGKPLRITLTY